MSATADYALKVAALAFCMALALSSMRQPVFAQVATPAQMQACNTTCNVACNVVAKAACPGFCSTITGSPLLCSICNATANTDCNNQCVPGCYANPDPTVT
ncbi:hypothetical protein HU200_012524 [Digitaria exilis]|uniref:Uncharacterized protein n=1 Tax=Digitaria exilis TaxID=1010633 RepID=A0A835ACJ6_9POAL|nr:hypothetical protein HU200_058311 [Digitaria exilis]KAF8749910.1 hypothetical protein HU200_012524 [Digitaria exilis]